MYQQSTDPKVYRHDDFLRFISDAKYYNSVLTIIYQDRIIVFRPAQVQPSPAQPRSTFFRIP